MAFFSPKPDTMPSVFEPLRLSERLNSRPAAENGLDNVAVGFDVLLDELKERKQLENHRKTKEVSFNALGLKEQVCEVF